MVDLKSAADSASDFSLDKSYYSRRSNRRRRSKGDRNGTADAGTKIHRYRHPRHLLFPKLVPERPRHRWSENICLRKTRKGMTNRGSRKMKRRRGAKFWKSEAFFFLEREIVYDSCGNLVFRMNEDRRRVKIGFLTLIHYCVIGIISITRNFREWICN